MTINWKKPTAQMLGRFQPFHDGHKTLFREILKRTGQVVIMIRDTSGTDDSNPFDFNTGSCLFSWFEETLKTMPCELRVRTEYHENPLQDLNPK